MNGEEKNGGGAGTRNIYIIDCNNLLLISSIFLDSPSNTPVFWVPVPESVQRTPGKLIKPP